MNDLVHHRIHRNILPAGTHTGSVGLSSLATFERPYYENKLVTCLFGNCIKLEINIVSLIEG